MLLSTLLNKFRTYCTFEPLALLLHFVQDTLTDPQSTEQPGKTTPSEGLNDLLDLLIDCGVSWTLGHITQIKSLRSMNATAQ